MNLARRILEGIHEVELEITPEFRKPEVSGVNAEVLNKAFEANGWKLVKASNKGKGSITNTYQHPMLAGASMHFTFNTDTGYVWSQMLVRPGEESEPDWFDAVPKTVENLTKDWLVVGEKYPSIEGVTHALESVDWHPMSTSSVSATEYDWVFQHAGVGEAIIVRSDNDGNLISAGVLNPDSSFDAFEPAVGNILDKAKILTSWASPRSE